MLHQVVHHLRRLIAQIHPLRHAQQEWGLQRTRRAQRDPLAIEASEQCDPLLHAALFNRVVQLLKQMGGDGGCEWHGAPL